MKVETPAYASQSNALFVSQGSRAHCFNERPRPHSNGLKPCVPPHSVASSRNKAVCAFRLVPRPRVWGCDGSLPSTKRIIAASGTRLDQHWCARAARFTRTHTPVRVAAVHRAPAEGDAVVRLERETTLQIMRECITRHGPDGWQRVRGGPWCSENLTVRPPGL